MSCEEFRDIAFDLASGNLGGEAAEAAKRHIEDCPQCRREYEEVLALTAALEDLREEPAPESLLPNVMNAISAEKRRRRLNSIVRFGTAAAAAVVLVVGAVNVLPRLEKEQPPMNNEQAQDVNNAAGDTDAAENMYDDNAMKRSLDFTAETDESDTDLSEQVSDVKENTPAFANKMEDNNVINGRSIESGDSSMSTEKEYGYKAFEDADEEIENDADGGIMTMSIPEDEKSFADSYSRIGGGKTGSAGGGSANQGTTPIITSDAEDESAAVAEFDEIGLVRRICEFRVAAEYEEAVSAVDATGKSMAQVSSELMALGVEYEVYVTEESYALEYQTADPERRAEIEQLCSEDLCSITIM